MSKVRLEGLELDGIVDFRPVYT